MNKLSDLEETKNEDVVKKTSSVGLKEVEPLGFRKSLFIFWIPALGMIISYWILIPFLISLGISFFESYLVGHIVPLSILFVFGIYGIKRDTETFALATFKERSRFNNFKSKDILIAAVILILMMLTSEIMRQVELILITNKIIPIPMTIPSFNDPRIQLTASQLNPLAGGIRGNYAILLLYFIMLFFNIAGEEILWRGYVLPRQEKAFGKKVWLIHGLLWCSFHAFIYWDLLRLLPVCLIISYVAYRQKRNWAVFIAHYVFNGLGFIIIVGAVFGLI